MHAGLPCTDPGKVEVDREVRRREPPKPAQWFILGFGL